jgi:hypothetical protein
MINTRASATLAFATTVVGASVLSGLVAMPLAHATELDDIAAVVKGNRPATCAPLVYNGALEGAAQAYARSENPVDGQPGGYNGKTLAFLGSGDPQAAAINSAFSRGAGGLVTNCDYTDFGVGFIRYEDGQPLGAGKRRGDDLTIDVVTIVFGAPPKAAAPVDAPKVDAPVAVQSPITCPPGSPTPTVPAGGTCDPVPVAPKNAIRVTFDKGFGQWTVNVTSSADIAGKCTYDVSGGVGADLADTSFDIGPKGTANFSVPAPAVFNTYKVVTSCHGDFLGNDVEFGHDEQTVKL